jgi:subtilisin-like proprotein convertase family protein
MSTKRIILFIFALSYVFLQAKKSFGQSYTNPENIIINHFGEGMPDPSNILVEGGPGSINFITVTLNNLSHTWLPDLDILLVSPTGESIVLMSDVGIATNWGAQVVTNVTYIFSDFASSPMLSSETPSSGAYQPTDIQTQYEDYWTNFSGVVNSPAPAGSATFFNVFGGASANGVWSLYVQDDVTGDSGSIAGGWSISFSSPNQGCMDSNACNYSPLATEDDGSCLVINDTCSDNNSNTMLDHVTTNCNCVGTPFDYGNIETSNVSVCSGTLAEIITPIPPLNITSYSVQWYYREGELTCPTGNSTDGWIPINGAVSLSFTPMEFTGTRTFACYLSPSEIYNVENQWIPGCQVVNYSTLEAQAISGNPNISPSSVYNYSVNLIPGNTYDWNVTNGSIVSGQGSSSVQVVWGQDGPYELSLSESNDICSGYSSLVVVNNSCPLTVDVSASNGSIVCEGGDNTLIATSNEINLLYQWFLNGEEIVGSSGQSISISSDGNYQVLIHNDFCSAASQIIHITEMPPVLWPEINVQLFTTECADSYALLTASGGNATTFEWSNGEATPDIIVSTSGEFALTVTNDSGCSAQLPPVPVNLAQSEHVPICLVTVDPFSGNNIIIWEPVTSDVISNYIILKEMGDANQYDVIGFVPYGSDGLFEDVNSNSFLGPSKYKLAINDLCNVASTNSSLHKTIHLTSALGFNNTVNLSWTHYEGVEFTSYNIYRGATPENMILIATTPSNSNSYSDLSPIEDFGYYLVEVGGITCDPSRSTQTSQSNMSSPNFVQLEEMKSMVFNIFPNPTSDRITLQSDETLIGEAFILHDTQGKVLLQGKIDQQITSIILDKLAAGIYFLTISNLTRMLIKN